MPGLLKQYTYGIPGMEKDAFLARLLTGLSQGARSEGRFYRAGRAARSALEEAGSPALENELREGIARNIGSKAMQAADVPLRGFDRLLTETTGAGLSPQTRYKLLKFVGDHPASTLGVVAAAVPVPMASELGMAAAGTVSAAGKKLLKIPVRGDAAMDALSEKLRTRGYNDVMDYLVKTKATPTPIVPEQYAALRDQLSLGSSSLV